MKFLYIDSETRSATPIRNGLPNYMADPYFEVLLVSWAINDEDPKVWDVRHEPIPKRLSRAVKDPDVKIVAHNSQFDRRAFNVSGIFGTTLSPWRFHDTMVQALSHGLPASLGDLSNLFGLGEDEGKLDGKALIRLFTIPDISAKQKGEIRFFDEKTHPVEWGAFVQYAANDISAMRRIHKAMPTVNYPNLEHDIWCIDQVINDRGIPVDLEFAEAAVREATAERKRLSRLTLEKTDGEVEAATQRDRLLKYLAEEHGVFLPDMRAATLERRLKDPDLPDEVRALIEIRIQSSQNAAAKYRPVLQHQYEGRILNTIQFCGASRTGRDAGRAFQPQNLKRPTVWRGVPDDELAEVIERDVQDVKDGIISLTYGDHTMEVLGSCVRGVIRAGEGKKLIQADLSNIEGRSLVWLSNERWKLEFFHDFDAGKIEFDNYVAAYARAMNVAPADVDGYQRDIGKVMELALGYGGGVAAFLTFADVYNLDIKELADAVWEAGDSYRLKECRDKHGWAQENGFCGGLDAYRFAACEYLKQLWREAHPATVKFWGELEQAFHMATTYDRETFQVGRLRFRRLGPWLYIRLPSGRCLTYLKPKMEDGQLSFLGWDSYRRRVGRIKTYSGKLSENVASGVARDVMIHRLWDVEMAGYPIVMRVHDELVCETPDSDTFSHQELAEIMARPYPWSDGFPLAADGFETYRYRKD